MEDVTLKQPQIYAYPFQVMQRRKSTYKLKPVTGCKPETGGRRRTSLLSRQAHNQDNASRAKWQPFFGRHEIVEGPK